MVKDMIIRVLFYIVGLITIALGITLTIKADLGAGAWDAINVGLTEAVGLTVGNWVMVVGALLIFSNAMIACQRPDIFSAITIVIIGQVIDFWLLTVLDNFTVINFLNQLVVLLVGVTIIGFGVSLYLQPKFSLNPVDGFMVALQKRFGFSLTTAKTLTEIFALLLALMVGGPIGIGTVIILVLIGPSIEFFDPKVHRVMTKLLS